MRQRIATAWRRLRGQPVGFELDPAVLEPLDPADRRIVERVWPYTMTGVERITSLIDAVRYCVRRDIPGDFAECGVWRGGSVLAMVLTLQELGADDRRIHLYDTFEGMTRPTEHDTSSYDSPALDAWNEREGRITDAWWAGFFDPKVQNDEVVRDLLVSAGYRADLLELVKGPVEETLPAAAPERLALLRLDTDWYESTKHELAHLYPRLSPSGVLIIDDYGHWDGARRAVDEYFAGEADPLLLTRVDYTARMAVKH